MINPKTYNLEERTFEFAQQVRRFVKSIPKSIANFEDGKQVGNHLGDSVLLFKTDAGQPSTNLNPRVTVQTDDARKMEAALRQRGVTIADPVETYGNATVGSFLDSEGNKLWFCSGPGPV